MPPDPPEPVALRADAGAARPYRSFGWLRDLGPGLISGAADDDPSGIVTYTQAGAQLGYAVCGILLLCYPLIIVTQEISARVGRATGAGLVASLRCWYPPWLVHLLAGLIVFTNTVNLGADLGAMADVLRLLLGGQRLPYVLLCGLICAGMMLRLRLRLYVRFVKWAALSLLVYVFAAFSVAPSWGVVLRDTLLPALPLNASSVSILVAVIGTTISPYLFIWQSSLEGERARGLPDLRGPHAPAMARDEIIRIRVDTCVGMLVAIGVAYAMVVTAGSALHLHGITDIETTADAARALRPLAGPLTHALFSWGILATGLLAVPMLAGSAAFALGESRGWLTGLARSPLHAPGFHGCIVALILAGMALNVAALDSFYILIMSAVINGVLSVPVLIALMLVATRPEIMGQLVLKPALRALGWLSVLVMTGVALALLATLM